MKSGGDIKVTPGIVALLTGQPVKRMCSADMLKKLQSQKARLQRVQAFCAKYKAVASDPKQLARRIFAQETSALDKSFWMAIVNADPTLEGDTDAESIAAAKKRFKKVQDAYWKLATNRADAPAWWKKANPGAAPVRKDPVYVDPTKSLKPDPTPPAPVKPGAKKKPDPRTGIVFYGDLKLGGVAWGKLCSSDDTSSCALALVQGGFNANVELGVLYVGPTLRASIALQLANVTSHRQPVDDATGEKFGDRGITYQPGLVAGIGVGSGAFTAMLKAGIHVINATKVPGSVTQYLNGNTYAGGSFGLEMSYEFIRSGLIGVGVVVGAQMLMSFDRVKQRGTETTTSRGEFTVNHKELQIRGGLRITIGRLETKKERYLRKTRERMEKAKEELRKARSLKKQIEKLKREREKFKKKTK